MEKVNETSKTQTTEAKIYAGIKSEIGTEMKLAEALEATKGTNFNIHTHERVREGLSAALPVVRQSGIPDACATADVPQGQVCRLRSLPHRLPARSNCDGN